MHLLLHIFVHRTSQSKNPPSSQDMLKKVALVYIVSHVRSIHFRNNVKKVASSLNWTYLVNY